MKNQAFGIMLSGLALVFLIQFFSFANRKELKAIKEDINTTVDTYSFDYKKCLENRALKTTADQNRCKTEVYLKYNHE
jgi:hypothetical protein